MPATVPASPFLAPGFHANEHPRAGSRRVLNSPSASLRGKAVTVIDWYDQVFQQRWQDAALAQDPLAVQYASRVATDRLPDNPHVVVVKLRGESLLLVHTSELAEE